MRDHAATVLLYGWVRLRACIMTRCRCGFVGGERRITSNNNNGTHYRRKTIGFEGGRGGDGVPVRSRCLGAVVVVVVVVVAASAYKSTADAFRVGSLARRARRVRPPLFNGHARRPAVGQWRARHRLAVTPSTLSSRFL